MRPTHFLFALALATSAQPAFAKLEVHEWGTFTSLVGSNGVTQPGLYHEDEVLPNFVHPFGELGAITQNQNPSPTPVPQPDPCRPMRKFCMSETFMKTHPITQKMETPVLYFYSDRAQHVDVNVRFPEGIVTETYPGPLRTSPTQATMTEVANGETTFSINVLAPGSLPVLPSVSVDNIYGHARNVASNFVTSGPETEKFIFYRGVGRYQPRFRIQSSGGGLELFKQGPSAPQASFLIDVDAQGDARLLKIGFLASYGYQIQPFEISALRDHSTAAEGVVTGEVVNRTLIESLVKAGLRLDEAKAMIATWEHGYLRTPGLRLLSILQQDEVDSILPLTLTPKPDAVKRVFVSRIEVMLDADERSLLEEIKKEGLVFNIDTLGRFAEPKLHRLRDLSTGALAATIDKLIERATNPTEPSGSVHL